MLHYVYLQALDLLLLKVFTDLRKSYLRSTVGPRRLSSISITNIERSYGNCILQEPIDRNTAIFGKRKDNDFFIFKHLNLRSFTLCSFSYLS